MLAGCLARSLATFRPNGSECFRSRRLLLFNNIQRIESEKINDNYYFFLEHTSRSSALYA